jgi:Kef-type K+ transport system membrane component KefB
MDRFQILREIGLIVVVAALAALAARRLRVPSIVAYMLAGIVLGPLTGLVGLTPEVELVSEAGIALLLFLVGLDLSIDTAREVGRAAIVAGGGQALITALGGYGLARLLGFTATSATFLAVAVTFSSTVVAVKLLEQRGETNSLHGRISVGILLVQDLLAVIVLTILAGMAGPAAGGGAAAQSLLRSLLGMVALTAVGVLAARWALPRLYRWLSQSLEAVFIASLAWCFAFIVAATRLGLVVEIGAFMAGVGLAQLPQATDLRRRVHPLAAFFVAVFFVSMGVQMQPAAAARHVAPLLVFTLYVLLLKPGLLALLLPRLGYGERTSVLSALLLGQVSEFSLIIAALGARLGLVGADVLSLIGVLALITIGISALAIGSADRVYTLLARRSWLGRLRARPEPVVRPVDRRDHIIIVGMNTLGRILVYRLMQRGQTVLAVDSRPAKLHGLPCETLAGSTQHPSVLEQAGLGHARLLISTLQVADANNLLALRCRELGVKCAIHAFDPLVVRELERLGVDYLMQSKHDGIRQVAAALRSAGVID